ncbi:hypothetical protein BsWGS_20123 [Bradybaena similaris]
MYLAQQFYCIQCKHTVTMLEVAIAVCIWHNSSTAYNVKVQFAYMLKVATFVYTWCNLFTAYSVKIRLANMLKVATSVCTWRSRSTAHATLLDIKPGVYFC